MKKNTTKCKFSKPWLIVLSIGIYLIIVLLFLLLLSSVTSKIKNVAVLFVNEEKNEHKNKIKKSLSSLEEEMSELDLMFERAKEGEGQIKSIDMVNFNNDLGELELKIEKDYVDYKNDITLQLYGYYNLEMENIMYYYWYSGEEIESLIHDLEIVAFSPHLLENKKWIIENRQDLLRRRIEKIKQLVY